MAPLGNLLGGLDDFLRPPDPMVSSVTVRLSEFRRSRTQKAAAEIILPEALLSSDELVHALFAQLRDENLTNIERTYALARLMVHIAEANNPEEREAIANRATSSPPPRGNGTRQMDIEG